MRSWLSNVFTNGSSSPLTQHVILEDPDHFQAPSPVVLTPSHHPSPSPAPPPTPTMGRWLSSLKVPPKKHKSPLVTEKRVSSPQLLDSGSTNVLQTAVQMASGDDNVDPDMIELNDEPVDPEAPPEPLSSLGTAATSSQQELIDVFKDKAAEESPEKMGKDQFFSRVDFLLALCEALHKYGLPTHRIEFQMAEAARTAIFFSPFLLLRSLWN